MIRFMSVGIDLVSTAVVLIPVMFILYDTCLKRCGFGTRLLLLVFAFYLSAVCSVTGIPAADRLQMDPYFNLIPFLDIVNGPMAYIKNSVLNILLFIPLGFLLPVIWEPGYSSLKKVFLTGLGVSAGIEVLQIFTYRLTDVDDLITNTAGTILGYYLAKLYESRITKKEAVKAESAVSGYEPYLMILIVFLIMFLIQPLIAENIWESVLDSGWWQKIK